MLFNQKNYLTILLSIIIGCFSLNAQKIRVVDHKGTIKYANNNKVTTSNTAPLSPLENDIWFDTNHSPAITKIWDDIDGWKTLISPNTTSKTIILNRNIGSALPTTTNTFFDLPLNVPHIQFINSFYYDVVGNSEIRVLHDGNYLISGEISVTNMPRGDTKYILGVFINGIRSGYLSRGFSSLPHRDYWGTTGTLMYALNQNDIVSIRYVINAGGIILNSNFLNIGITKL